MEGRRLCPSLSEWRNAAFDEAFTTGAHRCQRLWLDLQRVHLLRRGSGSASLSLPRQYVVIAGRVFTYIMGASSILLVGRFVLVVLIAKV